MSKMPVATPVETAEKIKKSTIGFIDVRSHGEYESGHAVGAQNIPLETLDASVQELKAFEAVYVICQSGGRSAHAVNELVSKGVNAVNVAGGTSAWRFAGLPME